MPSARPETAGPPSSADLIKAAVTNGTIDEATGYLYRFYAQWGDGRLPEPYRGIPTEDDAAAYLAERAMVDFNGQQQAMLRRFLTRPTDPASYWQEVAVARQDARSTALLAVAREPSRVAPASAASACQNGWARLDLPAIPVTIWGRCSGPNLETFSLVDAVEQVGTFMTALWTPMTNLMGKPIGDTFRGAVQAANEVAEAGDGRLDIYLVVAPNVIYARDVTNDAIAVTMSAPPNDGGKSSAYMVVDPTKAASAAIFKSNVAHEFFHVLAKARVDGGRFGCPYPNPNGACAGSDQLSHWFSEASAVWAEHHFVPEARITEVYTRFQRLLGTWRSLSDTRDINQYDSFLWPLFMEQESPNGAKIIGDTWKALEGKSGWTAIQATVNSQLPFEDHFRDFAVRVWNEELLPGDPITPRFQGLDGGFPTTRPSMVDPPQRVPEEEVTLNPFFQPTYTFSENMWELWADYHSFRLDTSAKRIKMNFSGLNPNASLDVDALVRVRDKGWERRKLGSGQIQWCLDKPDDAIEEFIIVLSNHSLGPQTGVAGSWTVSSDADGCATVSDTLVYTSTYHTGSQGDPTYQETHESMTLRVSLASRPADSPYAAAYLNHGSTFRADFSAHSEIQGVGGCNIVSDAVGGKGGPVPGEDGVVGNLVQEDNGDWDMYIAASVEVPLTVTQVSCLGTTSDPGTQVIQLQDCKGTEIKDNNPARIFDFNCTFQNDFMSWSVVGKVTLHA